MEQFGGISKFAVRSKTLCVDFPDHTWLRNKIYLYAVPRRYNGFREILITPVHPNSWLYTWEIKFMIKKDRPGIILDITTALENNRINIYKQEGVTPNEEFEFSFWVLVNLEKYIVEETGENPTNTGAIKQRLKTDLESSIRKDGKTEIEVIDANHIEPLFENHIDNINPEKNRIPVINYRRYFNDPVSFEVKSLKARIPIDKLFVDLDIGFSKTNRHFGTIFSDFDHKNIYIIRIFDASQMILYLDVRHQNRVGSIREVSYIIKSQSEATFNIIYNRATIKQDPQTVIDNIRWASHWYVLLEVNARHDCNKVIRTIDNCSSTFGNGSVEILDYTDNVKPLLEKKYRKKYPVKQRVKNLARNVLVTSFVLFQIVFLGLYISHGALISDIMKNYLFLTIPVTIVLFLSNVKDAREVLESLIRYVKSD